jgi:hypothetical protein
VQMNNIGRWKKTYALGMKRLENHLPNKTVDPVSNFLLSDTGRFDIWKIIVFSVPLAVTVISPEFFQPHHAMVKSIGINMIPILLFIAGCILSVALRLTSPISVWLLPALLPTVWYVVNIVVYCNTIHNNANYLYCRINWLVVVKNLAGTIFMQALLPISWAIVGRVLRKPFLCFTVGYFICEIALAILQIIMMIISKDSLMINQPMKMISFFVCSAFYCGFIVGVVFLLGTILISLVTRKSPAAVQTEI